MLLSFVQSFSLRPTVTGRPTFASGPAANVKVTAILEKANAIRQVRSCLIFWNFSFSVLFLFYPFIELHCKINCETCQAVGSDDGEDDDNWSDS